MIDPVNPGPAGSTGPAGVTLTGPTADYIANTVQSGGQLLSAASSSLLTVVQSALQAALDTVKESITALATEVTSQLGSAQTTANLSGAVLQAAAQAPLTAAAAAPKVSYTADQAGPNYSTGWNLWSVRDPQGWTQPIPEQYFNNYENDLSHCFRGWAAVYADALSLAASLPRLPGTYCPQPSFAVTPPSSGPVLPGACPSNTYHVWQQFLPDGSANCVELCEGVPGPTGYTDLGLSGSPGANAPVGTVYQCIPPSKGTGGSPQYYAGCVSGKAVSWLSSDPAPAGVTGQVGPFADQGTALLAAGACGGGTGTGNGNGTGGTGTTTSNCCPWPSDPVPLPKCIYIDLCDWQTFEDRMTQSVYKALCKFVKDPTCQCIIQDSKKYQIEDCDGQYDSLIQAWMGNIGKQVFGNPTLDDLVATAQQYDS